MTSKTHKHRELLTSGFLLIIFLGLAFAYPALATEYKPLVGIPGLPNDGTRTLSSYVNIVYLLTISIGALIAFLKITIAGVKYSLSDVITDKGEAKKEIIGALFGLAILLIPFLVLNTIYGGLININILDEARPVNVSTSPAGSTGGVQVGNNNLPDNDVPGELAATKVWPLGTMFIELRESDSGTCTGQFFYTDFDTGICITQQDIGWFTTDGRMLYNDERAECTNATGKALKKNYFGSTYTCVDIPPQARKNPYPSPDNSTSGAINGS